MQNPPILTVTGTRRPHDRAGRISPPHGIAIFGYLRQITVSWTVTL